METKTKRPTYPRTKRVAKRLGIPWCLFLGCIIILRANNLPVGNVQPEALMMAFLMALPLTLGIPVVCIAVVWVWERRRPIE